MRTHHVGTSGLVVSLVGLGCNNFGWRIGERESRAVVAAALAAGITFFDTAESYGDGLSERFLGRALGRRRSEVVLATKFGWRSGPRASDAPPGSRTYIRTALEQSLRRLGTDYVDLYQYHLPDGITPLGETLAALDELVRAGTVRYVGSSNMSADEVRGADRVAADHSLTRFVSAQNSYSWLERDVEADLVPACSELGLGLIPYFPLAKGLLTGKYRRGRPAPAGTRLEAQGLVLNRRPTIPEAAWNRLEALEAFAAARSLRLLDVAVGGLAAMPAVASVIAGATTPEQVRANAAAGEWQPSPDELDELRALTG